MLESLKAIPDPDLCDWIDLIPVDIALNVDSFLCKLRGIGGVGRQRAVGLEVADADGSLKERACFEAERKMSSEIADIAKRGLRREILRLAAAADGPDLCGSEAVIAYPSVLHRQSHPVGHDFR